MIKKYYLLSLLSTPYLFSMEPSPVPSVDFDQTYLKVLPQELFSQVCLYASLLPKRKSCVIESKDAHCLIPRVIEEQLKNKADEVFSAFIKDVQSLGALLKMDNKLLESENIHNTFLDVLSRFLKHCEIELIAEFFKKVGAGSILAPTLVSAYKHNALGTIEQLDQALDNYLEKHSVLSTALSREHINEIASKDKTIEELFLKFQSFLASCVDASLKTKTSLLFDDLLDDLRSDYMGISLMGLLATATNGQNSNVSSETNNFLADFNDDILYPDKAALKAAPLYYAYATKSKATIFKNVTYSLIQDSLVDLLYLTPLGSRFDKMFISALLATPQAFKWLGKYLTDHPEAATDCLCIAASLDNKDLALLALEHGANINGFQSIYCFKGTYLMALSKNRKLLTFAKRLTPLQIAVLFGHKEIVELLLQKGALTDVANAQGSTALTEAIMVHNIEIIKLLLEAGANPAFQAPGAGLIPLRVAGQIGDETIRQEVLALLQRYFLKRL